MVKGLAKLERKLGWEFPALVEQRTKEALEKAATDLVAKMKQRAPVYKGSEPTRYDGRPIIPGALRDSIGWTWGDAPKGTLTIATAESGLSAQGAQKLTIYAGNKVAFYARWIEFGTRKNPGSPFFFVTYRNNKRRIRSMLTRAVRKAIKDSGMAG